MHTRRMVGWALGLLFLACLLPSLGLAAGDKPSAPGLDKIEPALLDLLVEKGNADWIVTLSDQADLAPAFQIADWNLRGRFVYDALRRTAARSQAPVIALLNKLGLRHQTFLAGNELYVWAGNQDAAEAVARLPGVTSIRPTRVYHLDPLLGNGPAAQNNPQAIPDWGILDTGADQFWAAFGLQGQGITVANIDTGVQWDHPALVDGFKCPGDPSNPACWADPSNVCGGSACDNVGHGTHTMGTMAASDDPGLPYIAGMAPQAQWIACKGCEYSSCSDYALNTCADWILAPGGDPDNRPQVVNNSWGSGGCDTWYLPKVQAWRAAGIFPAFSAGNNYSCGSLGSPGDFQESFASASHRSDRNISDFSSKGPSCFGDDPYTKPNISAPGENICSTVPGSGWDCYYSGTSMASPHSAGAVALLWSCNPSLIGQIDATFEILQDNADVPPPGACGAPPDGEGNYTFGYGYLNVYQAGLMWCGDTGTLQGHVTDAASGGPVEGVTVEAIRAGGGRITRQTDAGGSYSMTAVVGAYDVTASRYGYLPQTVAGVEILTDTVTTLDFSLAPAAYYTVEGTVTDGVTGWPLYARIDIDEFPGGPVWTDPQTGHYSVDLAEGILYTFYVIPYTPGYNAAGRNVGPLTGNVTEDFQLQADPMTCSAPGYTPVLLYSQDFEAGDGSFVTYGFGSNPSTWEWGTPTSGPGYAHSGSNVWATNLWGNYSDYEDSYVESPDIDLSPYAGQGFVLSWWQWLQTEWCCDYGAVEVSNDGGGSWSWVYGPAYGDVDLNWAEHRVWLDAAYAVFNFRVRFHLWTDYSVTYPGYYVDDVTALGDCVPQDGGLVVGHVYDANTSAPLVGAEVSNDSGRSTTTVATPDDPNLDDAFYTLFSPPGDHEFTATRGGGYGTDSRLVAVVSGAAVRQDFSLSAGVLSFTPPGIHLTLDMGTSATVPSELANSGALAAAFEMQERDRGRVPGALRPVPGHGEWISRAEGGVRLSNNHGSDEPAYPSSYRWEPDVSSGGWNVLVYADDFVHLAPNTYIDRALRSLSIGYTAHYDGDFWGFASDLSGGGPWDLVLFGNDSYNSQGTSFPEMRAYVQGGGKLAAEIWTMLWDYGDPLYAELGVAYAANDLGAPPVYWWEPGHPLFNQPASAPPWLSRYCPAAWSCGQYLNPIAGVSTALAGYTAEPAGGQGTLIVREDGQTVFKGFADMTTDADADSDGVLDGVELWQNIITGLLEGFNQDVAWLAESPITGTVPALAVQPVDVILDAGVPQVTQPGEYYATLRVKNDTPYGPLQVPVTMTVVAPPWYGKLDGTVTSLGHCDANPAPLKKAQVLVEGSTGLTWTLETDAAGYYQVWLDEANSPLSVTVTDPEHETGQATGIVVVGQQTTTVDFDLRWLVPCLSVSPDAMAATLEIGASETRLLTLTNAGAADAAFEFVERDRGFQPVLARGPFARPSLRVPAEKADAASAEGLGLPAPASGRPLDAGAVLQSWPASAQGQAWGLTYTADDTLWVGDGWGAPTIYEYLSDGTPTGRQWNYTWGPYYGPADDAFNWNSGRVWTLDVGLDNCLHEMDPDDGYTGATICGPWSISQRGVAYDPDTDTWYVGGWNEGVVYHIDSSGGLLDSAFVGLAIAGLAYNPDTQHLFVIVNNAPNPVYVLDAAAGYALVGQFFVGAGFGPYAGAGLEIDCDGNLWAVDQQTNTVYQFESGETANVCGGDAPWLTEDPMTGTVPAGGSTAVNVTFDAGAVTQPGVYHATLTVRSDDPVNPRIGLPITLTVSVPPTWGKLNGTVTSLGHCDANPAPLKKAQVLVEGSTGLTWTLETDAAGYYQVWLDEANSPLSVMVTDPEHETGQATGIVVAGQQTTTVDFDLRWLVPCLSVSPDAMGATLQIGASETRLLTLTNAGGGAATFELAEADRGFEPLYLRPVPVPGYRAPESAGAGPTYAGERLAARPAGTYRPSPQARLSGMEATVLIVAAADANQIRAMLQAYPDLVTVDYYNARSGTPSLDQLVAYDCAIVMSNSAFANPVAMGNVLADYVDAGGTVVQGVPTFYDPGGAGWGLRGRFVDEGYSPFVGTGDWWLWADLGPYDPTHLIMEGVTYAGDSLRQVMEPAADAEWVASWTDDEFVATKGRVVALNTFLPDGYAWSGDIPLIVHNSAIWLKSGGDAPWLTEDPMTGTVPAGGSTAVNVTFDAGAVTQPGVYHATLTVRSDDPVNPRIGLPITLTVSVPPTWGKLNGTVTSLGHCDANPAPLKKAQVLVEGNTGLTWTLETDAAGYYQVWLDEANSPLSVTVTDPEHETGQATGIVVAGQQTTTVDLDLRWLKPCVSVSPDSLAATLHLGDMGTQVLTLANVGAGASQFGILEGSGALKATAPPAGRTYPATEAKSAPGQGRGLAPLSQGGPDPFGYTFMDSNELGGPQFEWIEIAPPAGGSGVALGMSGMDDGYYWPVDLPWTFNFYGVDYNQISVQSNGALAFSDAYLSLGNIPIPGDAWSTDTFIAHWWDDMCVSPGEIYYQIEDDRVIFEYYQNSGCCVSPDHATWEVILLANGSILMQYQDTTTGDFRGHGADATVGIQGDAYTGLQYSYNYPTLSDGLAVCFAYPGTPPNCQTADVPWLAADPATGTIPADGSTAVSVTFDAGAVTERGVYHATLYVSTDDPVRRRFAVPVTLTVIEPPGWRVYMPIILRNQGN